MILADIGRYLAARRRATLADLALHFRADPDAIRGMLTVLEKKGRLRRTDGPCGSCCGCATTASEIYEWTAAAADGAAVACAGGGLTGCGG